MSHTNLFSSLSAEWAQIGASAPAKAASAHWASDCPRLAGFASPAAVVERCNDRSANGEAQELLAVLLYRAGADRWAARAFLQAVLPGLAAISRRYGDFADRASRAPAGVWERLADLDQQVVATAYEVMHELAGAWHPWPANLVVRTTRKRVRCYVTGERRRGSRQVPDAELAETMRARPSRTPAEELVAALIDAVERGLLTPVDAGLVYNCRVGGAVIEDLAPLLGWGERRAYRHRLRAEEILVEEAFGCGRHRARLVLAEAS